MMIRAYREIYLSNVQSALGDALNYSVNDCNIPGDIFLKMFAVSSVSKRIENGDPSYAAGKSGTEIAADVVIEATGKKLDIKPHNSFERSKEYWVGWAVAYYQWYTSRKFIDIFRVLSYDDLQNMYYTLHEADISKFVDIAEARTKELFPDTNLKRIRSLHGYSQAELAKQSGVSLRSVQMYEQRNKDINRASVETVYRLSKALGCSIEDLIEL